MRRPTVILLVLFALIAGLTWYMQQPDNSIKAALATSTSVSAQSTETLVNPNHGMISRVEIRDAAGKELTVDNTSGSWTVNAGKDGPADQKRAETIVSMIYSMRIISKLEKAPDPAGTGLDKPSYTASVTQETGVTSFSIGKLSATGSGYYVLTADGKVIIASKDGVEAFIQNLTNPPLPFTATPAVTETPSAAATRTP